MGAGVTTTPVVPGYRVGEPVGFGAAGAVWSARDGAGRPVVVTVLGPAPGGRGPDRLRRLENLRGAGHAHLQRVVDVVRLREDRCALVGEEVAGPDLATARAARGQLPVAEVATVLAAVGDALAHLHARGVVHGDVAPSSVLLAPGGVPVLVGLAGEDVSCGTPGFVAPERSAGRPATTASDVWALARTVAWAAGEDPEVLAFLSAALDGDPAARPSAHDLAARAVALADARPVVLPSGADLAGARLRTAAIGTLRSPARSRRTSFDRGRGTSPSQSHRASSGRTNHGSSKQSSRASSDPSGLPAHDGPASLRAAGVRVGTAVGLVAATLLGIGAAYVISGAGERSVAQQVVVQEKAEEVVHALASRRDAALREGDADALAAMTVPGSEAAQLDRRLLDGLAGVKLTGLATKVDDVRVRHGDGAHEMTVDVVTRQSSHTRHLPDGRTQYVAAQEPRCVTLELHGPEPWKVSATAPCQEP